MGKKVMNKCKCAYCGNEDFEVPEEIIEAIKEEKLVIFAGAGISTEGKNVFKKSLYSEVNDELKEKYDNSFPELMTKYCNKPNGRRKLINKIRDKFEYYKSFPEIDNVMEQFYSPLADIYSIKEIITTNWDRQFEEKCGCIPIVYNKDIPLIDETRRMVYKIHGSIDNIGTLIMTQEDYDKCYSELRENLIGSRIKYLLSNKTILFIGYSLEDDDFKKIWQFIDECLGELKPHFFIVSPDEYMKEKLKDKNVTVINTLGSNFIKRIRTQLVDEKYIFESEIFYPLVSSILTIALEEHTKANKRFHEEKNSLLIYSLSYQDGIIHALKRMLSRECYGEYLNPDFLCDSIYSYKILYEDYVLHNRMFDASYICGYTHAMEFILETYNKIYLEEKLNSEDTVSLYYLPKNKLYNKISEFNNDIKKFKIKKYINIANEILEAFGNEDFEYEIHHLPFL